MTASEIQFLYEAGIALLQSGDPAGAREKFNAALAIDPTFALAHNGIGLSYSNVGQFDAALESYDSAIRVDPNFSSPYVNRSFIQQKRGDIQGAMDSLHYAIKLQPDNPTAHNNLGSILTELKMPRAAIAALEMVMRIDPDYPLVAGLRLLNKIQICDWAGFQRDLPALGDRLERGEAGAPPWALLPLIDRPDLQRKAAEAWILGNVPAVDVLGPVGSYPNHDRIRIGMQINFIVQKKQSIIHKCRIRTLKVYPSPFFRYRRSFQIQRYI